MSRKKKEPSKPPSKAYLVSFGDTMTALLAFFIVLNSFAKEQTGANMYTGTGSFVNAAKSIGVPGSAPGDRTSVLVAKEAPMPVYAFADPDEEKDHSDRLGDDKDPDSKRIIDRQSDNFKRFLTQLNEQFVVDEMPPTKSQIVFDSFEQLHLARNVNPYFPLKENAIEIAAEAIAQLQQKNFELEIVVWATMPSRIAMLHAMDKAAGIESQLDNAFLLEDDQRARLSVSGKPWLFSDAKRPKVSFILSRLDAK